MDLAGMSQYLGIYRVPAEFGTVVCIEQLPVGFESTRKPDSFAMKISVHGFKRRRSSMFPGFTEQVTMLIVLVQLMHIAMLVTVTLVFEHMRSNLNTCVELCSKFQRMKPSLPCIGEHAGAHTKSYFLTSDATRSSFWPVQAFVNSSDDELSDESSKLQPQQAGVLIDGGRRLI
ncbi:hypothetical protein EV361DRAFT_874416 [Lentinula raphanica]|nr:hypothetical protein EV361DRAFT_874416 [Lentinula raphanica]